MVNIDKELERCAKCGQCRSVCPIFSVLKDETLVARGRLAIIQSKTTASSSVEYNDLAKIIDTCLMCRRCEVHCPSLVKTSDVFKSVRQELVAQNGLPSLLRLAFRWVLPNRWLYDNVMRLASSVMRLMIHHRTRQAPLRHLPLYFTNLLQRLPKLAPKSALESIEHPGVTSGRATPVSIFIGCAANYIYPGIIDGLTSTLNRLGISYVIPAQQVCCGFSALLSGDELTAKRLMKINQPLFKTDTIITVCPTCNRMLREMQDTEFGMRSEIIDAIEFLADTTESQISNPKSQIRTVYHKPCHSEGTKAPEIIRALLKTTTDYQETDSDLCCGGGGLFGLKFPDLSEQIGHLRLKSIHPSIGSLTIVTNCPGCMMQLDYLLSLTNSPMKTRHIMNILGSSQ
jgi:glycolate oxidase iron-sulfur subunit